MLDKVVDFFLLAPKRLEALGRALVSLGGFVLLAGLIGWAARRSVTIAQRRIPGSLPPDIAMLLPGLPTWWVPETLNGALPALVMAIAGWRLVVLARRLRRYT